MAIRIRKVDGHLFALCATETNPEEGDLYLDDNVHHALSEKFYADFVKMDFIKKEDPEEELKKAFNQLKTVQKAIGKHFGGRR